MYVDCQIDSHDFSRVNKVERESILPLEEDEGSEGIDKLRLRSEFVFGLGETSGSIVKNGRRFTMEAKDSLCYGMESGALSCKVS